MIGVGMEDTYPHTPTGYTCTACGGIADAEVDGIYLCARDALRAMGENPESDGDAPTPAGRESVVLVDLTGVGEIRSTRADGGLWSRWAS